MKEKPSKSIQEPALTTPVSRLDILKDRALMLGKCRNFFSERGILEVDCPILSKEASVDAHIDLITASYEKSQTFFLHSSPEYGMKRLLSEGIGDIYQLSHVFRDGEIGAKHSPEFMMAEWYRVGFSLHQMIEETLDFIRLFLGKLPCDELAYREAFLKYAGIDYLTAQEDELKEIIPPHSGRQTKDDLLNIILALKVEPHLKNLTVITDYPASQAALAKIEKGTAKRFEVYAQGLELANGYDELLDAKMQKQRLIEANQLRQNLSKDPLPIDNNFLKALEKGVPSCSGVAVGFDRLMMLRHGKSNIGDVQALNPFLDDGKTAADGKSLFRNP